ncbi:MAG: hypothetical protein ACTTKL_05860 [Treponema sp.]
MSIEQYDKIEAAMKECETLAQTDLNLALEKMTDLYFNDEYKDSF